MAGGGHQELTGADAVAEAARRIHGEAGGSPDGTEHGNARHRGLLHEFEGGASGDKRERAGERRRALEQTVTDDLVERVVAADVLAQGDNAVPAGPERRGMHRAGFDIDLLQRGNALHRRHDLQGGELPAVADHRGRTQRLGDRVDAA